MRTPLTVIAIAATVLAGPALAEGEDTADAAPMAAPTGDAAAGETIFAKRCSACHVVVNDAGEKLAGKGAKTGPDLYNVAGHPAGAVEGFRYSKDLKAAGADDGLVWTEEHFKAWVHDPKDFLREFTGNKKARTKMSFRLRDPEDAANVYAYLVSLNGT